MDLPAETSDGFEALNASVLVAKLGGDKELLLDIIVLFQNEAPSLLQSLRDEARRSSAPAIASAAHVLKGSAANFGVTPLYELAREIEHRARDEDLSTLHDLMEKLEHAAVDFGRALQRMQQELQP